MSLRQARPSAFAQCLLGSALDDEDDEAEDRILFDSSVYSSPTLDVSNINSSLDLITSTLVKTLQISGGVDAKKSKVKAFDFQSPSPDDVVMKARVKQDTKKTGTFA